MLDTLNLIALCVGYLVLGIFALIIMFYLWHCVGGLRHSLDYHRWVIAQAKQMGTYEKEILNMPNRRWRYFKSVVKHAWEYAGMEEGSSIQRSKVGGWWQYRGNWVTKNGTKGSRYNRKTSIMR